MGKFFLMRSLFVQCIIILSALALAFISSCVRTEDQILPSIEMAWSFDSLDAHAGQSIATFTLINHGTVEIAGSDWGIYFSQIKAPRNILTKGTGLHFESITGDYRRLFPDSSFVHLAPGERRSFRVSYGGFAGRISLAPVGAYYVQDRADATTDQIFRIKENNTFPGYKDKDIQELLLEDVSSRYQENARIKNIPVRELSLVPTPVTYEQNGQGMTMSGKIAISYIDGLESEAEMVKEQLNTVFTGDIVSGENVAGAQVVLSIDSNIKKSESYNLNIANGVIAIEGSDRAGVFYGVQTLARLYPVEQYREAKNYLNIRGCSITDGPRFAYRGLQLDVSRNFHALPYVRKVIDEMSYCKLNKLHLTLTNDEGWRIEIPGLPELTEVGGRRGHTLDESDMLYPAYGSGPFADPDKGAGTGYYSRDEFIALLRYAADHHVDIIPEIDFPGHARAAIKAMMSRYDKYESAGDHAEAIKYLLHDPEDNSEYSSAQHYSDNVVCVCQESTYRFIEKVVDELVGMYREAEVPFSAIHSGGDEVPNGVWQKSPICQEWISNSADVENNDEQAPYFLNRFMAILDKYDLTTAGWEEITLKRTEGEQHGTEINLDFVGENVLPYVWNSVWGWGSEDLAYKLANSGYPIVMCNSGNLYFDLAYNRDPSEPGLTWSGYVDTRRAFEFEPMDMFATATTDKNGEPLSPDYIKSKVRLNESAKKNIYGIQGHLWSETVRSSDRIDYYLFPKLLGLAERAWSKAPQWTIPENKNDRLERMDAEWGRFANTVGKVELPRLDYFDEGVSYRIPMPGAMYLGGQLLANIRYPDLEIRYTTDGTEPTISSTLYEGQVEVDASEIRLRAFNSAGRGGRSSVVRAE